MNHTSIKYSQSESSSITAYKCLQHLLAGRSGSVDTVGQCHETITHDNISEKQYLASSSKSEDCDPLSLLHTFADKIKEKKNVQESVIPLMMNSVDTARFTRTE